MPHSMCNFVCVSLAMKQYCIVLCVSLSEGGALMVDGLNLLLCLNLARGHVAALIRTIRHYYGNPLNSVILNILFMNA